MGYKARPYKATLDIPLYNRGKEGLAKAAEELELANVVDIHLH